MGTSFPQQNVARTGRHRWPVAVLPALLVAVGALALAGGASASHLTLPSSGSFLYLDSEPGDYIGGGVEHLYTEADTAITGALPVGGDFFQGSAIQANYVHWWYLHIAAPAGSPLQIGSYEGAQRASFRAPGTPGLDVFGDGRGCNTISGRFDVLDLQRASTGELLVFDVEFEQHCEGGPAALRGRIRIENDPPPPDETAPTLYLPGDLTIEAPDSSGTPVSYSAYATDDRDASPEVSCSPASGSFFAVGLTPVSCTATDDSGNTASGSFAVTVLAQLELGVELDGTGWVDAKSGVASLTGTVRCSRAIGLNVTGAVQQMFARRVVISGYFSAWIDCAAPSTPFSVTVTGSNGRFGAGAATANVDAYGCELSCHLAQVAPMTVKLRGR